MTILHLQVFLNKQPSSQKQPIADFYAGGHIIISHPLGRKWLNEQLHEKYPETVPHPLPDQAQLEALTADLPLRLVQYVDEPQLYVATLQVSQQQSAGRYCVWQCSI